MHSHERPHEALLKEEQICWTNDFDDFCVIQPRSRVAGFEFFRLREAQKRESADADHAECDLSVRPAVVAANGTLKARHAIESGRRLGRLTLRLARRFERVIGLDISEEMVCECGRVSPASLGDAMRSRGAPRAASPPGTVLSRSPSYEAPMARIDLSPFGTLMRCLAPLAAGGAVQRRRVRRSNWTGLSLVTVSRGLRQPR